MKRAFEAQAQIATRHATSMWLVMLTALVLGLGALAAQAPAAGAQGVRRGSLRRRAGRAEPV